MQVKHYVDSHFDRKENESSLQRGEKTEQKSKGSGGSGGGGVRVSQVQGNFFKTGKKIPQIDIKNDQITKLAI